MILGLLLFLSVQADPSWPGENGIYVSSEGYVITLVDPYTVWATIDGRYHSAYGLKKVSEGQFEAKYDASRLMRPGYDPDPQISAQYDLLNAASSELPPKLLSVPLAIPCVPAPDPLVEKHNLGTLKIVQNQLRNSLHFNWTDIAGTNDYSGNAKRVGGAEWIDLDGVYSDPLGSVSISEQGSGSAKVIVGHAVVEGKSYKLAGVRVWDRGTFQLTPDGGEMVVGSGWFEWAPSMAFASQMSVGTPRPSDRMHFYVELAASSTRPKAVRILKRVGN